MRLFLLFILSAILSGCSPEFYEKSSISQASKVTAEKNEEFYVGETKHFTIYSVTKDKDFSILEKSYEKFYKEFGYGLELTYPEKKLTIICFASEKDMKDYAKIVDKVDTTMIEAYYSPTTNMVAIVQEKNKEINKKTITHEISHQLAFNSGMLNKNRSYPIWIVEGLATNFEINSKYSFSYLKGKRLQLEKFVGNIKMPLDDSEASDAIYIRSWGLFRYLSKKKPEAFKKYLKELSSIEIYRQTEKEYIKIFISAFGELDTVQSEFLLYINNN